TKDILAEAALIKKEHQTFIGFAAETQNLIENAKDKLQRKKLDWIVANDVSKNDIGFGADDNIVTLISQTQTIQLPKLSKSQVACEILNLIK
ncbi:MAG: phosphopantothenoylcysteine decarboxylase, partial [Lentisphaeria bacterium]